nr:hypothetical protein [Tanacetum cinerariifolium]
MKRTLKEDPAYYPADRGNNDDDESSNDDENDDDVEKDEEDEEEEEYLASADPSDVSTDDLETMTTVNQGMSVEEIEQVVAQRVANAIEAIAIYETKTNLAHKLISQTERKKEKVAENASNKKKWESNHNGSLRHYKSKCPIVKFHKRMDMIHERMRASKPKTMQDAIGIATKLMNKKISTLVECQIVNKKRQYAEQNAGNLNGYNAVQNVGNQVAQNPRVQNVGNQNGLMGVQGNDRSAKVHENSDNNEIFNMFTQEEQYTELLEPIPEPQKVPQNDNNVISEVTDVGQGGETVEQYPANFEETRALYDSLYQNLAIEVEKLNSVNRKLKETNADLTTELV